MSAAGARECWLGLCGEAREHEFTSPRTSRHHHSAIIPPGGSDDFGAKVVGGAAQAHAQQMTVDLRSANQREATDHIRHEALLRNVKFLPAAKVKRSLTRVWI